MFALEHFLIFALIVFAAFFLKAMTGFGPAIVVITFGSILLHPHKLIPLSSMLDFVAGGILFFMEFRKSGWKFYTPIAIVMMAGAVFGGFLLHAVAVDIMKMILSGFILLLGLWFLLQSRFINTSKLKDCLPDSVNVVDMGISTLSGILGGFVGISGPPIIWHMGRHFQKEAFRQALIPIFWGAALMRVITYSSLGMIDFSMLLNGVFLLPFLFLGLWLGNRIFHVLPEKRFRMVVGCVLIVMAARMVVTQFLL